MFAEAYREPSAPMGCPMTEFDVQPERDAARAHSGSAKPLIFKLGLAGLALLLVAAMARPELFVPRLPIVAPAGSDLLQRVDRLLGPDKTVVQQPASQRWSTLEDVDPLSHRTSYFAYIATTDTQGITGGRATLAVACTLAGTPALRIVWNQYIGSDDGRYAEPSKFVEYRFDDKPPQLGTWRIGGEGRMTSVDDPREWVAELSESDRLVVRTTATTGRSLTATFNIAGSEIPVRWVLEKCRYIQNRW